MLMQMLVLLKDDKSFWDKLKEQLLDVWHELLDFFIVIKENTYDLLCTIIDPSIANLLLIAIGIVVVMIIAITLINK